MEGLHPWLVAGTPNGVTHPTTGNDTATSPVRGVVVEESVPLAAEPGLG